MNIREKTIPVMVGNVQIGGNNDVVIQSMTNTKTSDVKNTLNQIHDLCKNGCKLVRVSIFDDQDSKSLKEIVLKSPIPIIADIHFNHQFAIDAIKSGVAKIRLNPGNISDDNQLKEIITLAKKAKVAIRIGVNSGSIPNDILDKYGVSAKSMIKTVEQYICKFEALDFRNIVISLKCSDPLLTIESYKLASEKFKYPLHIGVTEAGSKTSGIIKSCAGLSPLLYAGIGNTIRVSLTGNPIQEMEVCKKLLNSFDLYKDVVNIISCPTCGRLNFALEDVVNEIEKYTKNMEFPIKISILGCVVNGIGEGKEADIGIAGSKEKGIIFRKGRIVKTVEEKQLVPELKKMIDEEYERYKKLNN